MVRILILLLVNLLFLTQASGQKVKYKDLFILLNAKQYDQAEPFLRQYLAENDDNPNAFLFMGLIFQDKSTRNDVLKETELLIGNLDSAVLFYDKAYKQIDDKELRKNDEYYQAYNRRDLRTGKFGVQLSDVQFDLEKRMQALKERKGQVTNLKKHFVDAESFYAKSQFLYKDIQIKYGQMKTLYLRSGDTTLVDLHRISITFDSCLTAFKNYKNVLDGSGKTGYKQELSLLEIKDLGNDGKTSVDFYADQLQLWDYKKWADNTKTNIEKEVIPMRDKLISYDIGINKLREKLRKDSVSVKSDIGELQDKSLYAQLKKYDPEPLPMGIFEMKIAELYYLSDQIEHRKLMDTTDLRLKITMIEQELKNVGKLDSVAGGLESANLDEMALNYNHFVVNAYGTSTVLKSLIKTTKDFAERELTRKEDELAKHKEALRWIVTETDSIPLFMDVSSSSKFRPLILVDEKYTAGFQFNDSTATGYFSTIIPSRNKDVTLNFPVDKKVFSLRSLPVVKALSSTDESGQVFYLLFYSEQKVNDQFMGTMAKIYRMDGLAWAQNLSLQFIPVELSFQVESGEVSIKTSNAAGESKMVYLDRNGKRKEAAN